MTRVLAIFLCVALTSAKAICQEPTPQPPRGTYETSQDADAKAALMQGDRWRHLTQSFDEWLSVQKIYTDAEVSAIKASFQSRIAAMSPSELDDFISDTQERLNVLLSDEAADARSYLGYFNEQARRKRIAPSGKVPQVFDMTVSQLRQELHQFQLQRQQQVAGQQAFQQAQSQAMAQRQVGQAQQRRAMADSRAQITPSVQQQPLPQKPFQDLHSPYTPYVPVTGETWARWEVMRGVYGY